MDDAGNRGAVTKDIFSGTFDDAEAGDVAEDGDVVGEGEVGEIGVGGVDPRVDDSDFYAFSAAGTQSFLCLIGRDPSGLPCRITSQVLWRGDGVR